MFATLNNQNPVLLTFICFLLNLALFMKKSLVLESRIPCHLHPTLKSILCNVISLPCMTTMARSGFLAVVLHGIQVNAIPWEEASSTSIQRLSTSWLSIQTSKPPLITAAPSNANCTYESPNICGWIDHNSGSYCIFFDFVRLN